MPLRQLAASLALTLLLGACAARLTVAPSRDDAVVYVIQRGWHTDLGLPVEELSAPTAMLAAGFPGVRFLTFGFAERQFVVNRSETSGAMMNALLPSRSVLLMTALLAPPEVAFGAPNIVILRVSHGGLERIVATIWRELELSASGEPMLLAKGPYAGSVFYAARETYDGFYTCNTWTAATLRAGGLAIPSAAVLFAGQVMGPVRWIAAHQAR